MSKKNRARNEETLSYEIIADAPAPLDARLLLENARKDLENGMLADMRLAEQALTKRLDLMTQRLHDARAEIDRLHANTQRIKDDPLNEIVRAARARLMDA